MDGSVVQHLFALRHAQEARALLESLGAQLRHLVDGLAAGEDAVFLPVGHDVFGRGPVQAGHPLQQRGRGGVHVHTHGVDAVLHHAVERLLQAGLGHVVLVLSHADGHGVDLHQLRQGILESAGDGHRRAEVHVVVGKLLRGQFRRRVDRGARLVDDDVGDAAAQLLDHLRGHLLRLPGGGAVADGDVLHPVLPHQRGEGPDGLLLFPLAEGGIDHGGIQHLAGAVHHRHLAAVAVAGVEPHGDLALDGRLHQQGFEVQAEHFDGPLVGGVRQGRAGLPLHGREDEPVVGVVTGGADKGHVRAAGANHRPAQALEGKLPVKLHRNL